MGRHLVTPNDIQRMNELYLQLHTYAAVSREVGFSASTVRRYIIEDYTPTKEVEIEKYHYKETAPAQEYPKNPFEWNEAIRFLYGEKEAMEDLRKEAIM